MLVLEPLQSGTEGRPQRKNRYPRSNCLSLFAGPTLDSITEKYACRQWNRRMVSFDGANLPNSSEVDRMRDAEG
jgi:hypothetical protein